MPTSLRHRSSLTSSRFFGVLVALLAGGLLLALGWFLFEKFTAPVSLATLIPPEETYVFASVQTDVGFRDLTQLYTGTNVTLTDLLDLRSLGFVAPEHFLALVGDRLGVAFFGDDFDPQRFAFIADIHSRDDVRDYLAGLALTDETLTEASFRGTAVYTYPRSSSHAFAFVGDDLIFAADEQLLKTILDAADGRTHRVADTPDYVTVASHTNPRSSLFAYLSPDAVRDLATQQFSGFDLALAGGLADLFRGGGVAGEVMGGQLDLTTFFAVDPEVARSLVLTPQPALTSTFAALASTDFTRWYAGHDVLASLPAGDTPTAMLLRGGISHVAKNLFGADIDVARDLAPLLTSDIFWGATNDKQFLFAAQADEAAWQRFQTILRRGDGILARQTTLTLPDDTHGERLVAAAPTVASQALGDLTMTVFDFGDDRVWRAVRIGTTVLIASDARLIADAIDQLAAHPESTLPLADTDDLFVTNLTPNVALPWFLPFEKLVVGRAVDPAGLTVKLRLEP